MRFWSVLFALTALVCVGVFAYSPFAPDWWLPNREPGHVVSSFGREIDLLFVIILVITGAIFIGTQAALVWVTFRYVDRLDESGQPVRPATYFHGSKLLEVIWSIIPAGILVYITLYQMGTWAAIKYPTNKPRVAPTAEVTGRQFQWVMRYPGPDGRLHTPDDVHLVNDLHFVKGKMTLIHLKSSDVLHSFFLPQMRIKQDAVPGLTIPVWFDSDTSGSFELACAELCGWGHYKMRGNVTVHENQSDFDEWMRKAIHAQNVSQLASTGGPQREVTPQ